MPESSDADVILYYAPRTRSFTALWLLEELGSSYRLQSFELHSGRHREPDYLALNPMGKVPLVVDAGQPIAELGVMAIHLAERHPDAGLAPGPTDPGRADFLRWVFFSSALMEPALGEKFFKWEVPDTSVAWGSYDRVEKVLVDAVAKGPYLLGERFTTADVLVASTARFGQMFGAMPKDGPLGDYVARASSRPACQAAAAIERREGERFPPPARS